MKTHFQYKIMIILREIKMKVVGKTWGRQFFLGLEGHSLQLFYCF